MTHFFHFPVPVERWKAHPGIRRKMAVVLSVLNKENSPWSDELTDEVPVRSICSVNFKSWHFKHDIHCWSTDTLSVAILLVTWLKLSPFTTRCRPTSHIYRLLMSKIFYVCSTYICRPVSDPWPISCIWSPKYCKIIHINNKHRRNSHRITSVTPIATVPVTDWLEWQTQWHCCLFSGMPQPPPSPLCWV